jgi:hypothetical protein
MKTPDWNQIESALKAQDKPQPGRDSEAFWSEFRARAELMGQDRSPAPIVTAPRIWGAAMAMAATFAIMMGVAWMVFRPDHGGANVLAVNELKNLQVTNPNVSVMVLASDAEGTIVYITDIPAPDAPPPESPVNPEPMDTTP